MSRVQRSNATSDKDSFKRSFSVPESMDDWLRVAKSSSLWKKALSDLSEFGPGSRVKKKQHILMQALRFAQSEQS